MSARPSLTLRTDVTDKSIAYHHVGDSGINVAPFDVANKVDRAASSSEALRLWSVHCPCALLRQWTEGRWRRKPWACTFLAKNDAGVDLAHHRELGQHLGRGIDIGADIADHHRAAVQLMEAGWRGSGSIHAARTMPSTVLLRWPSRLRCCPRRLRRELRHRAASRKPREWRNPSWTGRPWPPNPPW